jgi:hypothetical protein
MRKQSAQLEFEWARVTKRLQHSFELFEGAVRLLADFAVIFFIMSQKPSTPLLYSYT